MTDQLFVDLPNGQHLLAVFVRLATAVVFGGIIGFERESQHKAAGLRTHMLVAGGAALFVIGPMEAGASIEHLTRVI
ncbi:MAG TPA: MgtC/SapB family protein, partial [Gemmataceae bacterium]|nr:MgtC/SapB family protein [Gemmataceae bacterium]